LVNSANHCHLSFALAFAFSLLLLRSQQIAGEVSPQAANNQTIDIPVHSIKVARTIIATQLVLIRSADFEPTAKLADDRRNWLMCQLMLDRGSPSHRCHCYDSYRRHIYSRSISAPAPSCDEKKETPQAKS
jgi:hypothetical protein